MGFGKMNKTADIAYVRHIKDAQGFASEVTGILASTKVYKEDKSATKKWAGLAAFSGATTLFRFRAIPGLAVIPAMLIFCDGGRYRVLSAEDVRGRGRYVEVLAERIEPVER
jgi:hypothetical protein